MAGSFLTAASLLAFPHIPPHLPRAFTLGAQRSRCLVTDLRYANKNSVSNGRTLFTLEIPYPSPFPFHYNLDHTFVIWCTQHLQSPPAVCLHTLQQIASVGIILPLASCRHAVTR